MFESGFKLSVKTFKHAISLRVIRCSSSTFRTEKRHEVGPELGFKLSVTMVDGTPKRAIHPLRKACATVSAVMSERGMASGQRVK